MMAQASCKRLRRSMRFSVGFATMIAHHLCRLAANSLRSATRDVHSFKAVRSSRNTLSSVPPCNPVAALSSGELPFQMRMWSSLTMSELSPFSRLTAMPPPSQSTSHSNSIPAATRISVRVPDRRRLAAFAAWIEIAGPVAEMDAEPERIFERLEVGVILGGDEKLHHADFLQRMLGEVRGIVAPDKTGIGLRLGRTTGKHPF